MPMAKLIESRKNYGGMRVGLPCDEARSLATCENGLVASRGPPSWYSHSMGPSYVRRSMVRMCQFRKKKMVVIEENAKEKGQNKRTNSFELGDTP